MGEPTQSAPARFVGQAQVERPEPPRETPAAKPATAQLAAAPPAQQPAQDRQWVPKLELPEGGGAIRGVGEKVEANAFLGSASHAIALPLPSARGGAPALTLAYGSGAGNGPFGVGWSLSVPTISRKTERELPRYVDAIESDTFLLAGAEDLVPLVDDAGTRVILEREAHRVYPYRPRVEGLFARIERWVGRSDGDTHWRVLTRDGVTSWYGRDASSRLFDPDDPARVFTWYLDETRDGSGNVTAYAYKADDLPVLGPSSAERNRGATTQRYLKRVRYGNRRPGVADDFAFELVFDFGEHAEVDGTTGRVVATPDEARPWALRSDPFSSMRAGFDVRTRRRCQRVLVFHRFAELGDTPTLVSSLELDYDGAAHLATLRRATRRSHVRHPEGGYEVAEFPAMRLRYSEARIGTQTHTLDPAALAQLPLGVDGDEYRFVDLDGEGLPGIVVQRGDVLCYMPPLGDGRYGALAPVASQVSAARLGQDAQLVDLDGDGRLELTVMDAGYHARTASGEWGPWRSFTAVPTIPWSDPQLRQLDLDGDGLPDLLLTEADHFVWVPSRGAEGWGAPVRLPKPGDERAGPAVLFDDAAGRIVLADMTGDGLQDIVRIEHAAVHYWPNLGHGRFGRRVTMDGDPFFAAADEFDARRVRLGDIDGSGTTDLVYLDERGARVWFNRSGNGWSPPQRITAFPGIAATTAVELVDVRGTGTSALVWSEAADWAKPLPVRYVDLALEKPHLLVEVDNGVGLVTRLAYEASTAQYLRDRAAGRPWLTRLPFPVQVVTRIETADLVAGRRFVQRFAYHHGYYDGVEREMRGFAAVDRWDTEAFDADGDDALFELELFETVETGLHQPPVRTRSWFHTGAYPGGVSLAQQLAREYFAGDSDAWSLPDTVMPAGLDLDDAREAARALRGRLLHEEIYAQDGSDREGLPYAVTEANYDVRRLQARGDRKHAVVFAHDRERLSYHYERDVDDPRIAHALVLEVDAYGDVLRAADVGYPRRGVVGALPEQLRRTVVIRESSFAAFDVGSEPDAYRAGVPIESRSYELLGGLDGDAPVQLDALRSVLDGAIRDVPEAADPVDGAPHLRLLGAQRTFYAEDDGEAPRELGDCGPLALVREVHAAAFSEGQRAAIYGDDVDDALLAEAGYVADDGLWWARSVRARYDPTRFFLSDAAFDPFGNLPTTIDYDAHLLFPRAIIDPLGNVVTAEHDYRVLAPAMLTDANGNRTAAGFDARGMVVWTAVMGKPGAGEGDTPDDPTTRFAYDLFAWRDRGEPNFAHASSRERHGDPSTRWLERRVYSDGSGRVLLEKASAEPGLAPQRDEDGALVLADGATVDAFALPRWIGSGRTVFDNKGNPVRQYEPYFSATLAYESEAELRERGVTAVLHYDPLGRVERTDFPDGTQARVERTPWLERSFDCNDTVLASAWHAARIALPGATPDELAQRRAAVLTAAHADTPTLTHADALGRAVRTVEDAGALGQFETHVELDVVGNVLRVVDARGNLAESRRFGMLRQVLETNSEDAGWRRVFFDVAGAVVRSWNARGFASRAGYDVLRRGTHAFVTPPGGVEILVTRTVWGEAVASATADNLRGRVFRVYDGAGEHTNVRHDFAGNLLQQSVRLNRAFEGTQDWSGLGGASDPDAIAATADASLEAGSFVATMQYDALGRVVSRTTPDGSETRTRFNEAGLLEAVDVRVRGAAEASAIVTAVDYDARGQRLRCVHGNGTTASYAYEPDTFRLSRMRLVRTSDDAVLQDLRYTYDPVGNIVEIRDGAQQRVYFDNDVVRADQRFEYDALYRLSFATGRELRSLSQPVDADVAFGPQPHADDPAALRTYEETYAWDEVGNIVELRHVAAGGNFTRRYAYAAGGCCRRPACAGIRRRDLGRSAVGAGLLVGHQPFARSARRLRRG